MDRNLRNRQHEGIATVECRLGQCGWIKTATLLLYDDGGIPLLTGEVILAWIMKTRRIVENGTRRDDEMLGQSQTCE